MWLSVHMPKTAGTTFAHFLRRVFRRRLCFCYAHFSDWRCRPIDGVPPSAACIHGHFGVGRFDADYPHAKVMVWLRDPVERVVSHYHFWRKNHIPGDPLCEALKAGGETLDDFARNAVLFNVYSKNLAPRGVGDLDFIGVTEQFDRSIAALSRLLNVWAMKPIPRRNVNEGRGAQRYEIDRETRAVIEKNNADDIAFYRLAVERFERDAGRLLAKRRWVWPHRWR